jgi:hypothetical protein
MYSASLEGSLGGASDRVCKVEHRHSPGMALPSSSALGSSAVFETFDTEREAVESYSASIPV